MKILAINPGGTSTKVAVYQGEEEIFNESLTHTQEDLEGFEKVFDQYDYRRSLIEGLLEEAGIALEEIEGVVGRGGLMKPIPGGTYEVTEEMIKDMENEINGEHASNLGALLAKRIADDINVRAFVVDPVSVDEFDEISRITGISDLEKASWLHSLNQKIVCRKVAKEMGGKYEDYNFIVAHLGSGNSTVAHKNGKMIDGSGGRTDGPFSPERSGGLLAYPLIELCYSGKYTREEMVDKVSNTGGFYDYLGTKNMIEVEDRIEAGDEKAKLIMDAYIYQVAREIAMYGATLYGKVDKIILTGGIAHSDLVFEEVKERVGYLAEVVRVPGELEMEALALGALRVLKGEEEAKEY